MERDRVINTHPCLWKVRLRKIFWEIYEIYLYVLSSGFRSATTCCLNIHCFVVRELVSNTYTGCRGNTVRIHHPESVLDGRQGMITTCAKLRRE